MTEIPEAKQKPPMGIMPQWLWKELRMWGLICALARCSEEGIDYHKELLEELNRILIDVLENWEKTNSNHKIKT